jgi:ionotropic kainate glutamate receptor 2
LSENPQYLVSSNQAGLQRVIDGNFAYFMESSTIDYITGKNCDLVRVGGLLNENGYGIAGQKNSPYISPLNEALLQLLETGKLQELYQKW